MKNQKMIEYLKNQKEPVVKAAGDLLIQKNKEISKLEHDYGVVLTTLLIATGWLDTCANFCDLVGNKKMAMKIKKFIKEEINHAIYVSPDDSD